MIPSPKRLLELEKNGLVMKRLLPSPNRCRSFADIPVASKKEHLGGADVVVMGFPWEGTLEPKGGEHVYDIAASLSEEQFRNPYDQPFVFGATLAPKSVRTESWGFSMRHGGGLCPELHPDLSVAEEIHVVDYGDVDVNLADGDLSFARAERKASEILEAGAVPIVIGGDNAITHAPLAALAKSIKGNVGIIHFDQHYDMDPDVRYDAAFQFMAAFDECNNVKPEHMAQIGISDNGNTKYWQNNARNLGVTSFTMHDVEERGVEDIVSKSIQIASKNTEVIFIDFDIDCVDPAFCPAQKYPNAGGLTAREVLKAIRMITTTNKLRGFSLCCLSPLYDHPNQMGSGFGARLIYSVISNLALQKMLAK